MILITCDGYIDFHVTRTGDYDSLLTLFITAYVLTFFLYVESSSKAKRRRWLLITALLIAGADLTKGIAGLLFLPACVVWVVVRKQLMNILRDPFIYFSVFITLLIILGYYVLREQFQPGYLQAVYDIEIAGYGNVIEAHQGKWDYYFHHLHRRMFTPWIYFLPLMLSAYLVKDDYLKRLTSWLLISASSFLVILSFGSTKLEWYAAPVLPLLSLLVAIGVSCSIHKFILYSNKLYREGIHRWIQPGLYVILVVWYLYFPYQTIFSKIYLQDRTADFNWRSVLYGDFMQLLENEKSYIVSHMGYNGHVAFKVKAFNEMGHEVITQDPRYLKKGDKVVMCEENVIQWVDKQYMFDTLRQWKNCIFLEVIDESPPMN